MLGGCFTAFLLCLLYNWEWVGRALCVETWMVEERGFLDGLTGGEEVYFYWIRWLFSPRSRNLIQCIQSKLTIHLSLDWCGWWFGFFRLPLTPSYILSRVVMLEPKLEILWFLRTRADLFAKRWFLCNTLDQLLLCNFVCTSTVRGDGVRRAKHPLL